MEESLRHKRNGKIIFGGSEGKLPFLPTWVFKNYALFSIPKKRTLIQATSPGTKGKFSRSKQSDNIIVLETGNCRYIVVPFILRNENFFRCHDNIYMQGQIFASRLEKRKEEDDYYE